jgi:hypothetical protein
MFLKKPAIKPDEENRLKMLEEIARSLAAQFFRADPTP